MANMKRTNKDSKQLRARAEKLLAKRPREAAERPEDDIQKLVHELQVHQIELEMQNDELRRTQLELEAARARLQLPYDAAPIGFLTLDAKGIIQESNLAAARMLNFDRVKLAGQNLTRFIAPESQDEFYLRRRQLFSTGEIHNCDLRMSRTGGAQFIAHLEAVLELPDAAQPPRCLAMLSDITERKRAEEIIRSQELQLREITDSTPVMLTRCSRDLHYQYVNRAYAEMLGLAPEQLAGKPIVEIMGAEAFEAIRPHVESVLQGQRVEYEHPVPFARVGARFLRFAYTPDVDESGGVRGWLETISDITERKRAEAALRESEARFNYMADAAPVLIWLSGPDKLRTYFNRPWLQFTGRSLEQELGNGWTEGVHPEDLSRFLNLYAESFDARQEFQIEYRLRRHDGEGRWILDHGIPRFTAGQEFLGYIGSCIDLTERKRAEEALRDSEARLATFAAATFEGIVESEAGRIIDCNEQYAQMLGYSVAELKGAEFASMIVPEDRGRVLAGVQEGQEQVIEHAMLRREGTRIMVEAHGRQVSPGSLKRHTAIRDITERKRAQEELQQSEERFRALTTASSDLIYRMSPDWSVMYQLNGRDFIADTEKPKRNWQQEYIHQDDKPLVMAAIHKAIRTRSRFELEHRVWRADGTLGWTFSRAVPLLDGSGEIAEWFGAASDITARKQAEQALQEAHAKLEQRVRERTKELKWANEELRGEKAFSESLIELAPAMIAVLDGQGNLIRTNVYAQQLTGYPFSETQGRNMIEMLVPQREQSRLRHLLLEALHGRLAQAIIAPARTRDGSIRQIEWYSKPIVDAAGEQTAVLAIGQDITERKQAEEFLRRSESHLSNFFNQAPIGMAWLTASGTVIRANRAQLDLLGCRAEDLLSHSFHEFIAEPAQGNELLQRLAARETVRSLRLSLRVRHGAIRHVLVDANSFWNGSQFEYSSIFLRDITDRVNLEREILQISEREQLRIAQDLHDGLGQLLVGAAYLAGTARQDLAAKSRPEARRLRRISEVINEALGMTRNLARGLHPVEPEPNGLMAALESLAARTKMLFQVRCRFNCRRSVLIRDNSVATHLFRIAQEAVTNAIKHGKTGRIEIHLTQTPDHIILSVEDDGSGIAARRLKQPGLGLRIMRYRAGMMGGSLSIKNEPGGGATIVCTLPLLDKSGRQRSLKKLAGADGRRRKGPRRVTGKRKSKTVQKKV
jgi:PAS domain S-box-containing protein